MKYHYLSPNNSTVFIIDNVLIYGFEWNCVLKALIKGGKSNVGNLISLLSNLGENITKINFNTNEIDK